MMLEISLVAFLLLQATCSAWLSQRRVLPIRQFSSKIHSSRSEVEASDAASENGEEEQDDQESGFFFSSIPVPSTGTGRREALAGATVLLSTPYLLKELIGLEGPEGVGIATALDEAVTQGDSIIRNLWLGRLAYPVLIVSLEVGVFEALKDGPLTKETLGKNLSPRLSGSGRVMEAILAVLASLELIRMDSNGRIQLTDPARKVLLRESPYFWGPQLLAADGITSTLRRAVHRDGAAKKVDYAGHSDGVINSFIDSMQAHGAVTAKETAIALDPYIGKDAPSPVRHVLDVAGGSGCFAKALYQSNKDIRVTLMDLPLVADRFQRSKGKDRRINSIGGDLFVESTWPVGPDCHLMANVLHDWGESEVLDILETSRRTLSRAPGGEGGRLIVIEQLLHDNKDGPFPASLASVSMLLGDWRTGKQYTFKELEILMKKAGFRKVELGPKCGQFHTAVIAYLG